MSSLGAYELIGKSQVSKQDSDSVLCPLQRAVYSCRDPLQRVRGGMEMGSFFIKEEKL